MIIDDIKAKYTFIKPCCVEGEPDAHTVWLKVGNQLFCVTPQACDTEQDAEWFRNMLAGALASVVNDFTKTCVADGLK